MAKTRVKLQGKLKVTAKKKKRGPNSTADVRKTKSIEEVLSIEPLKFSEEEDKCSGKHSSMAPYCKMYFKHLYLQGLSATPPILRFDSVVRNLATSFENSSKDSKIKIIIEDIEEEISFWNSSLGANPPLSALEDRDRILKGEYTFFNKRHVVMKDCRRKEGRKQEWIVKKDSKKPEVDQPDVMASGSDEFQLITKGRKFKAKAPMECLTTLNLFQALSIPSTSGENQVGVTAQKDKEQMMNEQYITRRREYLLSPMDKIISWNVRGISSQQKQNEVKQFIANQKVGLVGLLKTRVNAPKLRALYQHMVMGWCFKSNIVWHRGGRIIVSWNPL
uniref:Uncharacterized protein n=1 Tax=Cannabis sativa TaxID=3483 RepID=A0A803NLX3_CANSA